MSYLETDTDLDFENFLNIEDIKAKIEAKRQELKQKIEQNKQAKAKADTIVAEKQENANKPNLKSYLTKKNLMILGGVVVLGVGGYFAYKKFR